MEQDMVSKDFILDEALRENARLLQELVIQKAYVRQLKAEKDAIVKQKEETK